MMAISASTPNEIVNNQHNIHINEQIWIPLPGAIFDRTPELHNTSNDGTNVDGHVSAVQTKYKKEIYGTQFVPTLSIRRYPSKQEAHSKLKKSEPAVLSLASTFAQKHRHGRLLFNLNPIEALISPTLANSKKNNKHSSKAHQLRAPSSKLSDTFRSSRRLPDGGSDEAYKRYRDSNSGNRLNIR